MFLADSNWGEFIATNKLLSKVQYIELYYIEEISLNPLDIISDQR